MLGNAGKLPVIQSRGIAYFKSFHASESRDMMMNRLGLEFLLFKENETYSLYMYKYLTL